MSHFVGNSEDQTPREIQSGASIIRTNRGAGLYKGLDQRLYVLHCGKESVWVVIKVLNFVFLGFETGFHCAALAGFKLRCS